MIKKETLETFKDNFKLSKEAKNDFNKILNMSFNDWYDNYVKTPKNRQFSNLTIKELLINEWSTNVDENFFIKRLNLKENEKIEIVGFEFYNEERLHFETDNRSKIQFKLRCFANGKKTLIHSSMFVPSFYNKIKELPRELKWLIANNEILSTRCSTGGNSRASLNGNYFGDVIIDTIVEWYKDNENNIKNNIKPILKANDLFEDFASDVSYNINNNILQCKLKSNSIQKNKKTLYTFIKWEIYDKMNNFMERCDLLKNQKVNRYEEKYRKLEFKKEEELIFSKFWIDQGLKFNKKDYFEYNEKYNEIIYKDTIYSLQKEQRKIASNYALINKIAKYKLGVY